MKPAFAVAILLAIAPVSLAYAHHGWSSYDETRPISLKGPLRDIRWAYPHGTARMTWRGQAWDVVMAPIARMEARGLTPQMISQGQRVRITGYARKDGTAEMRLERLQVGDRIVEFR